MNSETNWGVGDYLEFTCPSNGKKGRHIIVAINAKKVELYSFLEGKTTVCKNLKVLEHCRMITSVSCTWG